MHCRFNGTLLTLGVAFAQVSIACQTGQAQSSYPERTVRIVVPAPPGPLIDALPRLVAEKLAARWGKPVIVENRPGAASNIGAEAVAKAEPDGHAILVTPPGPLVVSKWVFPKLGFDPEAFTPISILITQAPVIVTSAKVPAANIKELIALAKENPAKLNYGSPGTGSTPQLAMERFLRMADVRIGHVPYQGLGPAMNDLLAGHIDVMIDILGNVMEHGKDGRLRMLAVTTERRRSEVPLVPVVSEAVPGFTHGEWFALVGPPKLPVAIAEKISRDIAEILKLPDVAARTRTWIVDPVGSTPEEATVFIRNEAERWAAEFATTQSAKK